MRSTTPYFHQTRRKSGTIGYLSWMRSFVPVHHRPMGAFEWRGNDLHNDVISTSGGSKKPRPRQKGLFSSHIFQPVCSRNLKMDPESGHFHLRFPSKTTINLPLTKV